MTTIPPAKPLAGRTFPTKARGARPTFFDDAGATDAVIAIVTALAGEVWTLRERVETLEALLVVGGQLAPDAVDTFRPSDHQADARADAAAAYTARVFRVFEEMREETVAGESEAAYLEVVKRAHDEI